MSISVHRGDVPNDGAFQQKMAPFCSIPKLRCNPSMRYRTTDGGCNNLNFPLRGRSHTAQERFLPPEYGDSKFNYVGVLCEDFIFAFQLNKLYKIPKL